MSVKPCQDFEMAARDATRRDEPHPKHLPRRELLRIDSASNENSLRKEAWLLDRHVTIQKEALVRKRMKKCPNICRV